MPPKFKSDIVGLFRPRPKLKFIAPDPRPEPVKFTGIGQFLEYVRSHPLETPEGEPPLPLIESRIRKRQKRMEMNQKRIDELKANYNPIAHSSVTSDPYKTQFIGNIVDSVTEEEIRYELSPFGQIKQVTFVFDTKTGKRRPYCFVEYERESDFRNAMSQARPFMCGNKRVIIDCERARTCENWLPRHLGGGLGGISRRFSKSRLAMACQFSKKKRNTRNNGRGYRHLLTDARRKKEERLGITNDMKKNRSMDASTYYRSKKRVE